MHVLEEFCTECNIMFLIIFVALSTQDDISLFLVLLVELQIEIQYNTIGRGICYPLERYTQKCILLEYLYKWVGGGQESPFDHGQQQ